jgi:hypothetical protein
MIALLLILALGASAWRRAPPSPSISPSASPPCFNNRNYNLTAYHRGSSVEAVQVPRECPLSIKLRPEPNLVHFQPFVGLSIPLPKPPTVITQIGFNGIAFNWSVTSGPGDVLWYTTACGTPVLAFPDTNSLENVQSCNPTMDFSSPFQFVGIYPTLYTLLPPPPDAVSLDIIFLSVDDHAVFYLGNITIVESSPASTVTIDERVCRNEMLPRQPTECCSSCTSGCH